MGKDEILKYSPHLKEFSRDLRNGATKCEVLLWDKIRRKQIHGYQFLRQKPIDKFIVDFYCKELKLAIEVDGSIHIGQEERDMERQNILEAKGISFLRFKNEEIIENMSGVLEIISSWISSHAPLPAQTPPTLNEKQKFKKC